MSGNVLELAVDHCGGPRAVARECGLSVQAVLKWLKNGHLPRSEWTGETSYAETIARLANDTRFTRESLLSTRMVRERKNRRRQFA